MIHIAHDAEAAILNERVQELMRGDSLPFGSAVALARTELGLPEVRFGRSTAEILAERHVPDHRYVHRRPMRPWRIAP